MKTPLLLCLCLCCLLLWHSNTVQAQQTDEFDSKLLALATQTASKITNRGKVKVAVWGFVTETGEVTSLCRYLTEDLSVLITNAGDSFQVIDRKHLDMLLKEHNLFSEGYIDQNTAKELGRIIAVDAIITGTVTVLDGRLKVRVKVLDTETALQFSAVQDYLPMNSDVNTYLGLSRDAGGSNSISSNRGFNSPLSSNEQINNPETVNKQCAEENFGDLCVQNTGEEKIWVGIKSWQEPDENGTHGKWIPRELTLEPQETQCFYDMKATVQYYFVFNWSDYAETIKEFRRVTDLTRYRDATGLGSQYSDLLKRHGQIRVEQCKSKTFFVR